MSASNEELTGLLERHLPGLRAFVRLRMGKALAARESTSDLVQSVCLELLATRRGLSFADDAAFRGWLYTAALHKISQKARHHSSQKRSPNHEEDADLQRIADCYAACVTPSQDASAREQVATMEAAFADLDEREREAITLVKIAGLQHEQVASIMGCSVEASRTLLRRALVRLAGRMSARGC
ncbi:MAG: sigma-70 family RNA polymerase sigma factor [Planctomycetota bacterium]